MGRKTVRRWVVDAQVDAGTRPGVTSSEHAEIKGLRAKVRRLEEDNAILKAATTFLAIGRLGYPALSRLLGVRARTALIVAAVAGDHGAARCLTFLIAVVVAATAAGAVRGMLTLLNATAVTDRWGAGHYGRLTGLLSAPVTVTGALSPWLGRGRCRRSARLRLHGVGDEWSGGSRRRDRAGIGASRG